MSGGWQSEALWQSCSEAGLAVTAQGDWPAALPTGANLVVDSRQLAEGDLFVALAGANYNGLQFVDAAIAAGALAVVVDAAVDMVPRAGVRVLRVAQLAEQLSTLADCFYRQPSRRLKVIGVTGTNGKTTVCQLLGQLLARLGAAVATIGTLGAGRVGTPLQATGMTTADACTTQRLLAEFAEQQCDYVVMEVSSHALDQGRVAAIRFEQAIFTNLSRDHLDYHHTLQRYAAAKARLFAQSGLRRAILNSDDAASTFMATAIGAETAVSYYSAAGIDGNLRCVAAEFDSDGLTAQLLWAPAAAKPGTAVSVRSPLLGDYNLANLLAVISSALAEGWALQSIAAEVATLAPVDGRLQRINSGDLYGQPLVVVDYAHTPDALQKVLAALRPVTEGELWVVFGCGGDRDTGKRPLMAQIAERAADRLVITSDNPRSENPATIIAQISAGLDQPGRALIEADRAAAIERAIGEAGPLDTVVIAGKGHERYQYVAGDKLPFDDVAIAQRLLAARAAAGGL